MTAGMGAGLAGSKYPLAVKLLYGISSAVTLTLVQFAAAATNENTLLLGGVASPLPLDRKRALQKRWVQIIELPVRLFFPKLAHIF